MTPDLPRQRFSAHLVFGLLVIAVGLLFTLDNLNVFDGAEYISRYWPLGLVVVGVAKMAESYGRGSGMGFGILLTAIGSWLFLEHLDLIDGSFFWPLVLIGVGSVIVWQGFRSGARLREAPPGDYDSVINATAILSGVTRGTTSEHFRGGELTAFMGGCEIDLRQAAIEGEAVLDVFAMWGGIEISVPENWRVISRVTPMLGGFDDKTRPPKHATLHTLVVRGVVIMGGIEIKN